MRYTTTLFLFLFCSYQQLVAQHATVIGNIIDAVTELPIEVVTVYVDGTNRAVESDGNGYFQIHVEASISNVLVFTRLGYKVVKFEVKTLQAGDNVRLDVEMAPTNTDLEVIVTESRIQDIGMVKEDMEELKLLPTTTGNLESVLPHIALGTSGGTGGELSSQYNVRGGNYDENLVYVNDFEIYRPQLIRAGQQEGLSFPNIDLIRSLSFSSGGFQAKYGDKLSSVLDIKYKRPDSTAASIGLSLLGGSAHLEGSKSLGKDEYRKFRYLVGARYKTNAYLLGSLDTKGEYIPNFLDVQGYFTFDFSRDLQLGILGNFNQSIYKFRPSSRSTALGLIDFALQLTSEFEGAELDDFTTGLGGVSLTYLPDRKRNPFFLKILASVYGAEESEKFDILGYYRLSQIETSLGSDNAGEEVFVLGTGIQHLYTRNFLQSTVTNIEHRGGYEIQLVNDMDLSKSHFIEWSLKYQQEDIFDRINEWERLDSAGYSLSFNEQVVEVKNVLKTRNELNSGRTAAFLQNTFTYLKPGEREVKLTAGIRASYWDLNQETIISPRAQVLYKPLSWNRDISFKLASGYYAQSPFYRELRRPDGTINRDLKSQKSLHIVGGMTLDFTSKNRRTTKFRMITEAYYKRLWDLVSYEIDNVRIRYSGENDAEGYVMGIDMRLNGEFVKGAESWVNLSFLRAREAIDGVQHIRISEGGEDRQEVTYVPRPADQFMTLSVFFQDHLRRNENLKMHFNFTFGSGLPFGVPDNNTIIRNPFRFKEYHRVDIGFSALLYNQSWAQKRPNHFLGFTKNTWLSVEVFNLLQVANVASNTWIKSIYNVQYAVKNFLTSRRVNVRLKVDF
ncbi:MAG: carboxypeptidase-like regulatory domain-containing protein [Saprospiraceae bacterium]|nr:carboxypeptidase-like regulatory domain-containing protein [Saprospiraceae bacterium]